MERTWKPKAAGILCIVAGVISLIPATIVGVFFGLLSAVSDGIGLIFFAPLIPLLLFGIIQIVGGIYALRRRRWGLALAGSIFTLLNWVILGIFGIIALIAGVADNYSVKPDDLTSLLIGFKVGLAVFGILALLPLIFVIRGRREFK